MDVNKLAGWCLIVLGTLNIFREVMLVLRDDAAPGAVYALVTALFITLGVVLLIRKPIPYGRKTKRTSTARD
jgi:hypothetical protein